MKKTIIDRVKEKIRLSEQDFADAFISEKYQLSKEQPDESELAKAKVMMNASNERITWLKNFLKEQKSSE